MADTPRAGRRNPPTSSNLRTSAVAAQPTSTALAPAAAVPVPAVNLRAPGAPALVDRVVALEYDNIKLKASLSELVDLVKELTAPTDTPTKN